MCLCWHTQIHIYRASWRFQLGIALDLYLHHLTIHDRLENSSLVTLTFSSFSSFFLFFPCCLPSLPTMGQFQSAEVCTAPACIQAASHILENLAPNWKDMDPCTDFDKSEYKPT